MLPISGHGTLFARAPSATPTVFTNIAQVGDITPPELTRNEFDAVTQEIDIDTYILGILRRGAMTLTLNFLPSEGTQDHLTGLYNAIITNSVDGYRITFPAVSPDPAVVWIMSGQVQKITPKAPVDGKLSVDATFRFSGKMSIGGVSLG